MKKNETKSLSEILQDFEVLNFTNSFIGFKILDKNFSGNFLLVESADTVYSFNLNDIIKEEKIQEGKTRVTMRAGCIGTVTKPFSVSNERISILSISENTSPPTPIYKKGDPKIATKKNVESIKKLQPLARTLASVAANWANSCSLGDAEGNNCAHYLSDAFINAGYNELKKSSANASITAWCDWNDSPKNPASRPIRAKDMWEWFKTMASSSQRTKPSKGYWATFQWDASYSGGHVLLYDADNDLVYGTGAYWGWSDQYFYQW